MPDGFPTDESQTEMLIELEIAPGCLEDEIETSFTFENYEYTIGRTGSVEVAPSWEANSVQGCPSEYVL